MNRTGRVAVPRNPDLPLRVPNAQRNKWAAQQRRPTDLDDAAAPSLRSHEKVHGLDYFPSFSLVAWDRVL